MKKIFSLLLLTGSILTAVSCKNDDSETKKYIFEISEDQFTFENVDTKIDVVEVTAENLVWGYEVDSNSKRWLNCVEDFENNTITISVKNSDQIAPRTGYIYIIPSVSSVGSKEITVTQKGMAQIGVDKTELIFGGTGNEGQQITVKPYNIASWTVSVSAGDEEWLLYEEEEVVAGTTTTNLLKVNVEDKTEGGKRQGTITLTASDANAAPVEITVTQYDHIMEDAKIYYSGTGDVNGTSLSTYEMFLVNGDLSIDNEIIGSPEVDGTLFFAGYTIFPQQQELSVVTGEYVYTSPESLTDHSLSDVFYNYTAADEGSSITITKEEGEDDIYIVEGFYYHTWCMTFYYKGKLPVSNIHYPDKR